MGDLVGHNTLQRRDVGRLGPVRDQDHVGLIQRQPLGADRQAGGQGKAQVIRVSIEIDVDRLGQGLDRDVEYRSRDGLHRKVQCPCRDLDLSLVPVHHNTPLAH